MPYRANYPATVAEVLSDRMKFHPAALAGVRALARAKPWQGTAAERRRKLELCLDALAAAYRIRRPKLLFGVPGTVDCYVPLTHTIYLSDRMSVVTFLHEFGHARGFDERQTCRWSLNLFRRCFPRSYGRCRHVAHTLVNDRRRSLNERN